MSREHDVEKIAEALSAAAEAVRLFTPGAVEYEIKGPREDPVTAADHAVDAVLREFLPEPGEGWLSEETADSPERLQCARVWVVDPVDGTREFVQGIPEWCISIGLVEEGVAVAGGIFNPATGEIVLGAQGLGVTYNGAPASVLETGLAGARVLASRSETRRGEWERFADAPFTAIPCGSVAYKMGLVAAGRVEATFTVVPKSEWDVAAGTALVRAAGGRVVHFDGSEPVFNQVVPRFPNLIAGGVGFVEELSEVWVGNEHRRG